MTALKCKTISKLYICLNAKNILNFLNETIAFKKFVISNYLSGYVNRSLIQAVKYIDIESVIC